MPAPGRKFKVRTGCITCKIRKIKCDETKPSCLRCSNTGRKCDGYAVTNSDDTHKQKTLVIRPQHRVDTISNTVPTNLSILPDFKSADEYRWLQYFSQHAAPTLAEFADEEFWSRILPQLSVSEPAIRHALLAVGSSCARLKACADKDKTLGAAEHSYSVRQYSLAISTLRKSLAQTSGDPTVPLICCLLFICLECLYGNPLLMLEHLNNGLNIITTTKVPGVDVSTKHAVTQKLQQIFRRLDAQGALYGRLVSYETLDPGSAYDLDIPYTFKDMLEAKRCLDRINWASLGFIGMAPDDATAHRCHSGSVLLLQRRIQEQFLSWKNAVDNFDSTIAADDTARKNMVARLRIECWASFLYLSNCLDPDESSYNVYTIQFAALVSEARSLIAPEEDLISMSSSSLSITSLDESSAGKLAGFSLEASLIPSLWLTALKCRDPIVRREAVTLLAKINGREGLWDARLLWRAARRVIEIEEAGMLMYEGAESAFMEDSPSMRMQASNRAVLKNIPLERFRIRGSDIFSGLDEVSRIATIIWRTRPDDITDYCWTETLYY